MPRHESIGTRVDEIFSRTEVWQLAAGSPEAVQLAPCLTRTSSISASLSFRAHASGVAHGSSSGKFVAAPRFNTSSTIRRRR